jgi:predicted NBD/HSP70 family sugar kinase
VYASNSAAIRYFNEANSLRDGDGVQPISTFEQLLHLAEEKNPDAVNALLKMAHYLGVGVAMIITSLAPSVVVLVGEMTHAWPLMGPVIKKVVQEKVQAHLPMRIVPTDDQVHPRLRGAVAAVLHNQLGAPLLA